MKGHSVLVEPTLDVSGINEKFNIGIYYGSTDIFFCIFNGPDLYSYTEIPVKDVVHR